MADNGRWFKLWCSCASDPSLDNLPIADFGRWAKLGAIIKEQGTDGVLIISEPSRLLCAALQCETFDALIRAISTFPNVTVRRENSSVSGETNTSVSFRIEYANWAKYQGDFSTHRVRKFRDKNAEVKRSKRRGEEKRGEETKNLVGDKSPTNGHHPIKDLLTIYDETYCRLHGQRPVITGADAKAAEAILKNRSELVASKMVKSFLEDPPGLFKDKRLLGMRHILSAANTLLARREVSG